MRTMIGCIIIFLGMALGLIGIIKHKALLSGVKTVYTNTVDQAVIDKAIADHDAAEDKKDTQESGPVKIEFRYYRDDGKKCIKDPDGCVATGEYQLRDTDSKVWMMKFCDPTPDLHQGKTFNIRYMTNGKECTRFVWAKPLD